MILLVIFSFLAGIVTILSPCILPILPIVLSSSLGGKSKPLGIVIGFVGSFTFFTLFLSSLVKATGLSADFLRNLSIAIILLFGLSFLIPKLQLFLEQKFSQLISSKIKTQNREGLIGGVIIGLSLGLLWTPCVGPILASVISLAFSGAVTGSSALITLAYSIGTAIPMLIIMYSSQNALKKLPSLAQKTHTIQQVFGIVMIATALMMFFNYDRKFQQYILEKFPQYGIGLTALEDNSIVKDQLDKLGTKPPTDDQKGKPMFEMLDNEGRAPELVEGGQWYNLPAGTSQLSIAELKGKVVLIDFWTYTCINCIRTLPYLRDWHEKYADQGLVIIGVHTPEFEFEKNPENVGQAISDFELKYPVMQDNDYATWRAFNNRYWPAKYLIDAEGNIRYHHFGEGQYEETEKVIQELLKEAGREVSTATNNSTYENYSRTPEIYLGYGRMEYLSSPEPVAPDRTRKYTSRASVPFNTFAFKGEWMVGKEYSMPAVGAHLYQNFEAKEVFLVMRSDQKEAQVRVYLDGEIVDKSIAGEDVVDGVVTVNKDRLYKLIRLDEPGNHTLRLEFIDGNVEVFAFTFG